MSSLEKLISENNDVLERIRNLVIGTVIMNKEGSAMQTSYDNATTQSMIQSLAGTLVDMSRSAVRDVDPTDDLKVLRIKTKKLEYMIAPEDEFTLIVSMQN